MAVIYERPNSRQFQVDGIQSTFQYLFRAKDYASNSSALTALLAQLAIVEPVSVLGVPLLSRSITGKEDPRNLGSFDFVVDYRHESNEEQQDLPIEEDDEKISFSFSGGPTFFSNALSQTKYGPDSRDVGSAINVLTNGSVEGIELQIPDSGFTVDTRKDIGSDAATINAWVKARIEQLWKTNDSTFRSLDAEDCLFTGFSGNQVAGGLFDLSFEFAVAIGVDYTSDQYDTGRVQFTIGSKIPGFHVIWVQYETKEDSTDSVIVPEALGVYDAKVLETTDFSNIGIAT